MGKDVYDIGELPPIGEVPPQMHAMLVRPDRYGEPRDAIRDEVIDVPEPGPHDVLVAVMAAGVNFNNVWAARGIPVDVTKTQARWNEPTDFHIVGSDASGIVYAVGSEAKGVQVGDQVTVHPGQWDHDDPWVVAGKDPGLAASFRVWGYDTCWGSMAQFTKVQDHQCMPKAEQLTWEEAAAPTLTGGTAYRMLFGWPPNVVEPGDPVLVWGGAGGLGSLAVQLVTNAGGRAVAVALAARHMATENIVLKEELAARRGAPQIVGDDPRLKQVSMALHRAAATDMTVLLEGESGTGKELFARALHALSPRADGPFVAINCAAIPETLLETELFGHEKGAFTGANARKPGKFELAHRGTLFLDEIGDLPLTLQAKILRALEEKRFERVGGTAPLQVDVRVVAATNRNLRAAVAARQYREDLYFRLSVFPITIPPLRERLDDIPRLARHFIERFCRDLNKKPLLAGAAGR